MGLFSPGQAAERYYVGARLGMSQYDGTVDASRSAFVGTMPPSEISIDGLLFESDQAAWGVYGGWRVRDWIALELGFNDLGNTGRETFVSFNGLGVFAANGVAVDVEEMYLATRFTLSLPGRWHANWTVGITQTTFDTIGAIPLLAFPLFAPPPSQQPIPYATPDDETGFI